MLAGKTGEREQRAEERELGGCEADSPRGNGFIGS